MKKVVAHILPALTLAVLVMPVLASAAAVPNIAGGTIGQTFTAIVTFMNGILVPFVFALAFLVFIWGMFKAFILGGSDEAKQSEGKALMFYAIIGFVVMVSIWGIVNLLADGFNLKDTTIQGIPNLPYWSLIITLSVMIAYANGHVVAAQSAVQRIENAFLFPLISFMFALGLLYFLWGAYEFVANADNESARGTGKSHMMWGLVGMVIMLSAYAILKIAAGTVGVNVP